MKHSGYLDINKPRDVVVAFFSNPENQKKWQDGFVKASQLIGKARENGAVLELYYKYGNKEMVLTETVTSNLLPDSFEATYHHKHMDNTMKYTFSPLSDYTTRYVYEFEYTRINWILPKLMALLFPGIYRKQGEKWMRQFKDAVEKQ
ncbi:MAG: SRPBCC family protein [Bacteroidota bacterium]